MKTSNKIKLVVVNENTLGYIDPRQPDTYGILHASIFRGATFELYPTPKHISSLDKIRLASKKDFADYRCSFVGYAESDRYEYDTLTE